MFKTIYQNTLYIQFRNESTSQFSLCEDELIVSSQ